MKRVVLLVVMVVGCREAVGEQSLKRGFDVVAGKPGETLSERFGPEQQAEAEEPLYWLGKRWADPYLFAEPWRAAGFALTFEHPDWPNVRVTKVVSYDADGATLIQTQCRETSESDWIDHGPQLAIWRDHVVASLNYRGKEYAPKGMEVVDVPMGSSK